MKKKVKIRHQQVETLQANLNSAMEFIEDLRQENEQLHDDNNYMHDFILHKNLEGEFYEFKAKAHREQSIFEGEKLPFCNWTL